MADIRSPSWVSLVATCNRLHDQAMRLVGPVMHARLPHHLPDQATLKAAAELVEQAAGLADQLADFEPSRSKLFRAAAWLWLLADQRERAAQLARRGLAGHPPRGLALNLRELICMCGEEA